MSAGELAAAVLRLPRGLALAGGTAAVPATAIRRGEWVVFEPPAHRDEWDRSGALARTLATVGDPAPGDVELFGVDLASASYGELLRLRPRVGFVQGSGGLLANRSIRANLTMPIEVHAGLELGREAEAVEALLARFALAAVADRRPHEIDGGTRFRVCAARAVALAPCWLVIEGPGDLPSDGRDGPTWPRLLDYLADAGAAAAVCLRGARPGFAAWCAARGARVVSCADRSAAAQLGSQSP